jgi:hypothetical protein
MQAAGRPIRETARMSLLSWPLSNRQSIEFTNGDKPGIQPVRQSGVAAKPAPKPCPPRNEGHPMTNYKSHSQPEAARKSHLRFFCDESSKVTSRWRRFPTFMVFAGFSVLEFAVLSTIKVDTSDLDFWIVVAGAIFFPVLAILSLLSIWNNWTREQEDRAFNVLRYMCLIPIILGGAMLVSVGLFLFWGWLGIIPSWAAVIAIFLKN